MAGKWKFFVEDKPWLGSRALHMQISTHDRRLGAVCPLTVKVYDRGMPVDGRYHT